MWAEGEGREAIKALYMRSAGLNGDAVVVFVRALCAVSQVSNPARPANHSENDDAGDSCRRLGWCGVCKSARGWLAAEGADPSRGHTMFLQVRVGHVHMTFVTWQGPAR